MSERLLNSDPAPDAPVLHERRGEVLLLTLNRPERMNAWSDALEDRYFALLDEADADPRVRAIVVTGAGRAFCAGADVAELEGTAASGDATHVFSRPKPRSWPLHARKPLIAAINGAAAGLGLIEALYCDVRFCTPEAKLTTSFTRRGLIAEYGLAWLLPRIVGRSRALDLLISGRVALGEEGHRMGLVDHLAPREEVVEAALAYAQDLARNVSPTAMAIVKGQVHRAPDQTLEEGIADADRLTLASAEGVDFAEGVASFLERRPPAFAPLGPDVPRP